MMKNYLKMQKAITLTLALVLALAVPAATYAKDGKKHFKEGVKYASNRQWDKAAEKFALAVAEKPNNIEYQLHFHRSLVNAAIMLVERGDTLFEQKDYNAAYNAYRQAFAFDRSNELALIKMRRMLEIQGLSTEGVPSGKDDAGPSYTKPSSKNGVFRTSYNGAVMPANGQLPGINSRRFPKTTIISRNDSLKSFVEQLGQDMGLNVMFDQQVERQIGNQKLNVDLRDVTKPKALEMILQTNNLMYAQIDTRTIVIAADNPQARMRYEPLSVRTFYIKNGDIGDIRQAVQATLQTKNIVLVKQLNALVVRDTPTNLELIESMIRSMDKSQAEVLIDINIYEVSQNDLLRLGNQFNIPRDDGRDNGLNLGFIGGIGQKANVLGLGPRTLTGPLAFALGLPPSLISFFQDKGKAKLLASTQVHVLDQEQNTINIGQRVPVQTAFIPTFGGTNINTGRNNNNNNNQNPANQNNLGFNPGVNFGFGGGGGFPSFQYENVGLNIDMQPKVYEDEVQLKMKIDTSTIDRSTGDLTPSFNQRAMTSVARIKDGQTTLIAGVSQTETSKQVKGIPLIGLIPIIGRFFATPSTVDRQSDVVITVTPHILRRADIREEDHLAKDAGTQADPRTQLTLEQILYLADLKDAETSQVAAAAATNQNQPYEAPKSFAANVPEGNGSSATIGSASPPRTTDSPGVVVTPPDRRNRPNRERRTSFAPTVERRIVENSGVQPGREPGETEEGDDENSQQQAQASRPVNVTVRSTATVAAKNQDIYAAIIIDGNAELSSTNVSLNYDPNILEVKGVRDGGVLQAGGTKPDLQFTAENGTLNVQLTRPAGASGAPARGTLLLVIFKVKEQGISPLTLVEGQTVFYSPSGEIVPVKLISSQLEAR
ncbi:MAG: cohesin domain-containing protein [Blastocatellia bacterium]|nr:cohesin domain-containing protein [Blastocatellia bacterium]